MKERATPATRTHRRTDRLHRVIDVVDGDTVSVSYRGAEVSVRVIGIDTPEPVHPSVPVECGGPQASATAKRLQTGRRVRLVFDPSQGRTDYYGRTLAYLAAPDLGDFGLAMIRQGRAGPGGRRDTGLVARVAASATGTAVGRVRPWSRLRLGPVQGSVHSAARVPYAPIVVLALPCALR